MSTIPATDWAKLFRDLGEWSYFAREQENEDGEPTRRAVQRAIWLACGFATKPRQMRMAKTRQCGVEFIEGHMSWVAKSDGSAYMLARIADDATHRTEVSGAIP